MSYLPNIDPKHAQLPAESCIRAALRASKVQPRLFKAGTDIQHAGDRTRAVFLVKSGWLSAYSILADGQRQLLLLHQSGDFAGLTGLNEDQAGCSLRSLRDSVVYSIPLDVFTGPSFMSPILARHLFRKSAQAQKIMMRTLEAVGSMNARHRVVWFILMLHDRLGQPNNNVIDVPLNQGEVGDLLGLTNVSVSKMLCQLSEDGFIDRRGSSIFLRRKPDLQAMVSYEPMSLPAEKVSRRNAPHMLDEASPNRIRSAYPISRQGSSKLWAVS